MSDPKPGDIILNEAQPWEDLDIVVSLAAEFWYPKQEGPTIGLKDLLDAMYEEGMKTRKACNLRVMLPQIGGDPILYFMGESPRSRHYMFRKYLRLFPNEKWPAAVDISTDTINLPPTIE